MELEELSRQIAKETRQLQAEIEYLRLPTHTSRPTGSTESFLSRIEDRLIQVQGDTGTLVQRVPENLSLLLGELKEVVLERIDSLKQAPTGSNESTESVESKGNLHNEFLQKLTPREQTLLKACFESGLITYKEVAARLGITPTSAKNIVNRIFQSTDKRRFFRKMRVGGVAKIGIDKAIEKRILSGKERAVDKRKKLASVIKR